MRLYAAKIRLFIPFPPFPSVFIVGSIQSERETVAPQAGGHGEDERQQRVEQKREAVALRMEQMSEEQLRTTILD